MRTIEDNKLIAEFIGYPKNTYKEVGAKLVDNIYVWYLNDMDHYYINGDWIDEVQLRFDTDWNWIMKAVDKIESMSYAKGRHYYLLIDQSHVQIRIDRMNYQPYGKWGSTNDKLKAIHNAVIEFINFYNRQQNEN